MRRSSETLAWTGLVLSLLLGPAARAEEGPAYLVKDIEPSDVPFVVPADDGSASYFYGATPRQLTAYQSVLLFVARDEVHGFELWRSDGTEEGTWRVKDICPGGCSSELYLLGEYRGQFYFVASDGVTGRELWRTDGTEAGTERVVDLCPGACGMAPSRNPLDPFPTPWAVLDEVLYFSASSHGGSLSLWRTDGTAAGTWQVKSFCALAPSCDPSTGAYGLTPYQGRLLFGAANGQDFELWTSDGTAAGTYEVIDLCGPFSHGGRPYNFHSHNGAVYFGFSCGFGGAVFKTDGTAEGTQLLASYSGGVASTGFVGLHGLLFFNGGAGQLWRTDGTPQGTYGVADFGQLGQISAMGDALVFPAERSFGSGRSTLWVSDGTGAGTFEIPHAEFAGALGVYPSDGKALFAGGHTPAGEPLAGELWVTDGTPEGTSLLQEIHPGPIGSVPGAFRQVGSHIFFIASDPAHHTELWALPRTVLTGPRCFDEPTRLCLQEGRFEVSVRFRNQHAGGADGVGKVVPWSRESGTFTFFDAQNTELVVKVLDGRALTGSFWVFYGALSNVEYWVEVKDWQTGLSRTYHNEPGRICGGAFLGDFPAPPDPAPATAATALTPPVTVSDPSLVGLPEPCVAGPQRLCLQGGRVEVSVHWRNQHAGGTEGVGTVLASNTKTGIFSFFNPGNIELVVKALDGTPVNGRIWFFYGALSDVEYWITARDTLTGVSKTYHNPPGRICGVGDTGAL